MANIEINITENGTTTLATAGKYCDRNVDVVVDVAGGGGVELPEEAFLITGESAYKFSNNGWNWFIEQFCDRVTTEDLATASYMFQNSTELTSIPFDLNFRAVYREEVDYMFQNCHALEEFPVIRGLVMDRCSSMCRACYRVRSIPVFENLDLSYFQTASQSATYMFESCFSLRSIPEEFLNQFYTATTGYYNSHLNYMFQRCSTLDEVIGLRFGTGTITSNAFLYTFGDCTRLKNVVFATQEDGTPFVVSNKNQVIDLSSYVGYATTGTLESRITGYNSGITSDKKVTDDATYQALKDDADWYTCDINYSRYNHDSAVATINSLPDTSAYLATAGGTNTIKFKGEAGALTDGGAINTLTEEEIAVATAKGWTVTLV